MSHVINLTDGVLQAVDGTSPTPNTLDADPTTGDAAPTNTQETEAYLHRGKMIADGSGTRLADEAPSEVTFTLMLESDEMADGENWPTLFNWMRGNASAALTAAGWTATTTRTGDSYRTLHFDWYPNGTASGAAYYRVPDAILVNASPTEGRPTQYQITVRSATQAVPSLLYVP